MVAALQPTEILSRPITVVPHWQDVEEDVDLDSLYGLWQQQIDNSEEMFREHVYENPNPSQYDYRQHRMFLYSMLWTGENLVVGLIRLKRAGVIGTDEFIQRTETKLAELRKTLHHWHGGLENQPDIPEDFKQAVEDVKAGKLIDMETALTEVPPNAVSV